MYIELEHTYNNIGLIELENQLEEEKKELRVKHDDARAMFKLRKNQDKHLHKHETKNSEVKGRVSKVAA